MVLQRGQPNSLAWCRHLGARRLIPVLGASMIDYGVVFGNVRLFPKGNAVRGSAANGRGISREIVDDPLVLIRIVVVV